MVRARPCRYSCFYLTRNSLTYTAPAMVADTSLGIGITEVGPQGCMAGEGFACQAAGCAGVAGAHGICRVQGGGGVGGKASVASEVHS